MCARSARRRRPDVAGGDEPALRRRERADDDRRDGRSPPALRGESEVEAVARAVARAAGVDGVAPADAPIDRAREVDRAPWCGPAAPSWLDRRHRRRAAAAGRPRARARDERRARQRRRHGRLHRAGRGAARRSGRVAARAGGRHGRGRGRAAADPRRQPGLHGAGRRALRRARSPRSPLRVHLGLYDDETSRALPLARPRGASARGVERRPRLRRHGDRSCSR